MSRLKIGSRVGAIQSMAGGRVHFYGFGVYDGEYEPPCDVLGMKQEEYDEFIADLKSADVAPQDYVLTSPRITLDDGRLVWGARCWWASEKEVRKLLKNHEIILV